MKKTGAGGKPQEYDADTGEYENLPSAKRIVKRYESRFGSVDKVLLSSSEWRRYYDTIGDMQAGTVREHKTKDGSRWLILNVNELQDGTRTPARLILDNGSYENPRVKKILTFSTDDELFDFIDLMRRLK